jgi:hypothetical protein
MLDKGVGFVKVMCPGPIFNALPVHAFVDSTEIGPWSTEIREPVKCLDDNISIAHDVLPQAVYAVIYDSW